MASYSMGVHFPFKDPFEGLQVAILSFVMYNLLPFLPLNFHSFFSIVGLEENVLGAAPASHRPAVIKDYLEIKVQNIQIRKRETR